MSPPELPSSAASGPHRVQAAARYRERLRRRMALREWARLPAPLVVALLLHGAVGFYYIQQLVFAPPEEVAKVARITPEDLTEPIAPEEEPEPPPLEEPEVLVEDPVLEEVFEPTDTSDPVVDLLGLGGGGQGGGGGWGAGRVRGREPELEGLGGTRTPFDEFVGDLRARGLDVAIVVDATGSMQRFIDRARDALDRIVADISHVVPDARLAVVAYRDLGDDWTTRRTDLTSNHYVVHNFLFDLEAAGGMRKSADFEEAVEVGLAVAADELAWREGSRRVIILVGDAPYHEEDRMTVMGTVRDFSRHAHSLVNAVYVGAPHDGRPTRSAQSALDAFERIADTGDGHLFELFLDPDRKAPSVSDLGRYRIEHGAGRPATWLERPEDPESEALRRRVLEATFGPEWREEVDQLLDAAPRDRLRTSAAKREARGDRAWFAAKLLDGHRHPAIVDGARRLFDVSIAAVCVNVLQDPARSPDLRAAVLNILKTRLDGVRGLPFDVEAPVAEQTQVLALIRREVSALPGAAEHAALIEGRPERRAARPPPPPPTPAGG